MRKNIKLVKTNFYSLIYPLPRISDLKTIILIDYEHGTVIQLVKNLAKVIKNNILFCLLGNQPFKLIIYVKNTNHR